MAAAVLTISDTAFAAPASPELDTTGPFIAASLREAGLFASVDRAAVPDSVELIRGAVERWARGGSGDQVRLIVTTGGTGMGVRDVTVEAVTPLFAKPLPALAQALTSYGLTKTPLAALSNPTCGVVHGPGGRRVLVVCLPGSRGGVKDGMAVLAPLLAHVLSVVDPGATNDADHAQVHGPRVPMASSSMAPPSAPSDGETAVPAVQDHCCSHHHPVSRHSAAHQHPAPGSAVAARQRQSPHAMVTLAAALSTVHSVVDTLSLGVETRAVDGSLAGHVLAEAVSARHDLPAWHSTNVDGYAVCSSDGPGEYAVRPRGSGAPLAPGQVERVNTGGPVPAGADAVVMVEDTELVSASEAGEELVVRILGSGARQGDNVRLPGSDLKQGEQVMAPGERVGSAGGEVGVLSSVGRTAVAVVRKPRIALLSTGSELVDLAARHAAAAQDHETGQIAPLGKDGSWTGINDSNRPALRAVAERMGWEVIDLGVVRDEPGAHEAAMRKGLGLADVVISTGGTSMGEGDLVKPLLEHAFGATIHFGRVSMAPGKPTTFASVPSPSGSGPAKLFFALPGNPASALVTFFAFVVPALRGLGGWKRDERELRKVTVKLAHAFPRADRPTYHRCTLSFSPDGLPTAQSTGGQRSSRVASVKAAEVLVLIEAADERGVVEAGEVREGLLLPGGWGA